MLNPLWLPPSLKIKGSLPLYKILPHLKQSRLTPLRHLNRHQLPFKFHFHKNSTKICTNTQINMTPTFEQSLKNREVSLNGISKICC